jgi:hypothetical protein
MPNHTHKHKLCGQDYDCSGTDYQECERVRVRHERGCNGKRLVEEVAREMADE